MNSAIRLADLSAVERLHLLPDSVPLTTSEAAIFLRVSDTTLERWRRAGTGPVYSQAGEVGSRGTNQKCLYLKSDLVEYLFTLRVTSSMDAAVRKGQMAGSPKFKASSTIELKEIINRRAFLLDDMGRIELDIESMPASDATSVLGRPISWKTAAEAMLGKWQWAHSRAKFGKEVARSLILHAKQFEVFELVG